MCRIDGLRGGKWDIRRHIDMKILYIFLRFTLFHMQTVCIIVENKYIFRLVRWSAVDMRTFEVENLIYLHMSIMALIELHMRCVSIHHIYPIISNWIQSQTHSCTPTHTYIYFKSDGYIKLFDSNSRIVQSNFLPFFPLVLLLRRIRFQGMCIIHIPECVYDCNVPYKCACIRKLLSSVEENNLSYKRIWVCVRVWIARNFASSIPRTQWIDIKFSKVLCSLTNMWQYEHLLYKWLEHTDVVSILWWCYAAKLNIWEMIHLNICISGEYYLNFVICSNANAI